MKTKQVDEVKSLNETAPMSKSAKPALTKKRKSSPIKLFDLISDPEALNNCLPVGEANWSIMEVRTHSRAIELANASAKYGFPTLMFNVNETAEDYLVAYFSTELQEIEFFADQPKMFEGIVDRYFGWQRIIECGRNPLLRPCIGWWNI